MKVFAVIKFGDSQTRLTIPCGSGNKTFKWLGNVASQRFSTCIPNGSLRRMEALYSGSESAQYQTKSVITPSGDSPHPSEYLHEHLQDGDEVRIELYDILTINNATHTSVPTSWTTMAYSLSENHLNSDLGSRPPNEDNEENEVENLGISGEFSFSLENTMPNSQSHINFVKLMFKSLQIDVKKVEKAVEQQWPRVEKALTKVNHKHVPIIKATFADYWDLLNDIYNSYNGEDGVISKESYLCFVEDSAMFPVTQSSAKGLLIYHRTCVHTGATEANFKFDCFLVSLLYVSQLKYNDTLDPQSSSNTAYDAVERIICEHLVPLAHRLDCLSVLKSAFFSDECLMKVRYYYDNLQDLFGKSAAKLRDIPSTVSVKEFNDLLYNSGLVHSQIEEDRCKQLLLEVRHGTLYGREVEMFDSQSKNDTLHDSPITEFTFPEFVEALARASYYQHMKMNSKGPEESQDSITTTAIIEQMIRGITAMADLALGKNVRAQSNKDKRNKQNAPLRKSKQMDTK